MPSESMVSCPSCGAGLPTSGLKPGVLVQCARCNWQFRLGEAVPAPATAGRPAIPPPPPGSDGTSGLAITSFVLGLAPCFCLTGIPAIFCGAFALSEISKEAGRLRGTVWAVIGIILGAVWSLMCAVGVGGGWWAARTVAENFNFSNDPQTVSQAAEKIGVPEAPEGIEPIGALDTGIIGIRAVFFADEQNAPNSMIMVMEFPAWIPMSRDDMESQMRDAWRQNQNTAPSGYTVEETKRVTYKIRGEDVEVNEIIGKDSATGRRSHEYIALLQRDGKPVMILVHTTEPPEETSTPAIETAETDPTAPAKSAEKPPSEKPSAELPPTEPDAMPAEVPARKPVHLTEEQVRKFFESFP